MLERKRTIFLVDDEKETLTMLKEYLEKALPGQPRIITAVNGLEARDKLSEFSQSQGCPDAIVTDVVMPGMNGNELIEVIRKHPVLKGSLIIMMSGFPGKNSDLVVSRAKELGCFFVQKPFSLQKICQLIEDNW